MKNVQIPDDVYRQACELAEQDHVSVDRVVAAFVYEGVEGWSRLKDRASRGSVAKLKAVLEKVSSGTPETVDQI